MKSFLYAAVALSMLAPTAHADPQRLTDAELDNVTAGVLDNLSVLDNFNVANNFTARGDVQLNTAVINQLALSENTAAAIAVGAFSSAPVSANVVNGAFSSNFAGVGQQ